MFGNNEERNNRKREFVEYLLEEVRKSIYEWRDNENIIFNTTREQKKISIKLTILSTIMELNENSAFYAKNFKLTSKEVEAIIDSYYRNVHLKNY